MTLGSTPKNYLGVMNTDYVLDPGELFMIGRLSADYFSRKDWRKR